MVIMGKINEVFFSEHGLTSTSASHLADLAQEVIAGNETKLKNMCPTSLIATFNPLILA